MKHSMPDWLNDMLDTVNGNPDPSSILGYTTDVNTAAALTMTDLKVFMCHSFKQHVLYYEVDADGKKFNYECLECPW